MQKIFFIADYFSDDLIGGGEMDDDVLIDHLQKSREVEKVYSADFANSGIKKDDHLIIGNFVQLNEYYQNWVADNCQYIIFEHDFKFLKSRDPSTYKNFKAPKSEITNEKFYNNAKCVVCHSNLQSEILSKNLPNVKVKNIHCALWPQEQLNFLSLQRPFNDRNGKVAILDSNNPIKQTAKSVEFCKEKNLDFKLLPQMEWESLMERLVEFSLFCFFPKVVESFSRTVTEAKMLGLGVITSPKKLGAASESLFNQSGHELIETISEATREALAFFQSAFEQPKPEIIAILNVYRRPHLLQEQIDSLKAQTIPPKEIWVWVNHHDDNASFDFENVRGIDKLFKNDFNWKYHGRFSAALLTEEDQVIALFDDDTIPGNKWFENCLNHWTEDRILGGVGCLLESNDYINHKRVGWAQPNKELKEVDLVGHAWFFGRKALKSFWAIPMFTRETGEDMHLSFSSQMNSKMKTFVPPHPMDNKNLWSSLKGCEYGIDNVASSRPEDHRRFYGLRNAMVEEYIRRGWKTVKKSK